MLGSGNGFTLTNTTDAPVVLLEIGPLPNLQARGEIIS